MTFDDRSRKLGEGSRSLADCKDALDVVRTLSDVYLGKPTTEEVVRRAEETLGIHFPPSLRHFVLSVGKCDIGLHEILGIHGEAFATEM